LSASRSAFTNALRKLNCLMPLELQPPHSSINGTLLIIVQVSALTGGGDGVPFSLLSRHVLNGICCAFLGTASRLFSSFAGSVPSFLHSFADSSAPLFLLSFAD
jgi:hypothetical protein